MKSDDVIFNGIEVMAVWLMFSGVGAVVGRLAAVGLRRPKKEGSEWMSLGGAVGCVGGFLAMIAALANVIN